MRPQGVVGWFVTVLSSSWFEYMASPNHAMERTPKVFASRLADRRDNLLFMTSTLNSGAQLALMRSLPFTCC